MSPSRCRPAARLVAPLENNRVLGEVDEHFGGDYLNEETILKAARGAGFSTAAIGKLGPVLIFDHTERTGQHSVIVDDVTGHSTGIPLSDEVKQRLAAAQLPLQTPARGDNAKPGTATSPTSCSRPGSPMSWPRRCCRCSRSATSLSSSSSGRAIPTPRSTARATARCAWCRASTGRHRSPPSATPTIAWPA